MLATSLEQISASIARRDLSVVELVSDSLARLDATSDMNATAWRNDEAVIAEAEAADEALRRDHPTGPLHGVPITVKDWIDVTGFPCSGLDLARSDRRPVADATAVARLRQAGAIVIAKSNAGSIHGVPTNPYDATRTPGYSSSGDAISVATGASAVGLGSDSGGSLRFPAHCSGIATIRPTYGRVPASGHFPAVDGMTDGRTVIGPLCRSAGDLSLVLGIISGSDGVDPNAPPMPDIATGVPSNLQIVLHTDHDVSSSKDVSAMMERVSRAMEDAGHRITTSDVLQPARALNITQQYWDSESESGIAAGRPRQLLEEWETFKRYGMEMMQTTDLIVSPAAPYVAPPVGVETDVDWTYTLAPSLWGFPAAVARCGTSYEGLPLGVQIVGRAWEEPVAISLAVHLENMLGVTPGVIG